MTAVNNTLKLLVPTTHYHYLPAFCFLIFVSISAKSQDTVLVNKKRLMGTSIAAAAGYSVGMAGLYDLWYKNSEHQSFTFFNDNKEWKQIDKVGHFGSSFYLSYVAQRSLLWSGLPKKKADVIGACSGFLILLPIEIFDGFSSAYGASTGDIIANAGGSLFFLGQQSLWNEVRIFPKFSFHTTRFAAQRPEVLGNNVISEIFKDYNGQTYWLSADVDKFMTFPKWLNVSVGYGAENMVFARDHQNRSVGFEPYRQFYVSLDLDLTAIQTRSKTLKTLLFFANIIKIPAPTIGFSSHGTRVYPFYF
jgi:hypothetical protein